MKKICFVALLVLCSTFVYGQSFEREIFVAGTGDLLLYTLSNNIRDIERAIHTRAGMNINLSDIRWQLNPALCNNVRDVMTRENVKFSMTTYIRSVLTVNIRRVIVNRRVGDNWFIAYWSELMI